MVGTITRTGHVLMVIAILTASGGHWAVLQTIAWGGMLVEYSQQGGITKAVGETFDGKHPCALCCSIQKGKQTEKKQLPLTSVRKLTLIYVLGTAFIIRPRKSWTLNFSDLSSSPRSIEPLLEPPQLLLS